VLSEYLCQLTQIIQTAGISSTEEEDIMLVRSDPFREFDRMFAQLVGAQGAPTGPAGMAVDAWREGDAFFLALDLPGVDPESIDLDIDRNVLSVRAERRFSHENMVLAERRHGAFSRQFILGDMLDLDGIKAGYDNGVLTLRVPIAERAKPRKISVSTEQALATNTDDRVLEGTST
jgi:HSP20 family protein